MPVNTRILRIAIARDAAFNFYYQNDLDAFGECGSELIVFDTLHDKKLPQDIDAYGMKYIKGSKMASPFMLNVAV